MKKMMLCLFFVSNIITILKAQDTSMENITCKQSSELIQQHSNDTNFIILDLRTEQMYNEGHIENSLFHDVFSADFEGWLNTLDKNKTYLLYCNVGHRSGIALDKMEQAGFKNLYHLYEGIREWEKQGFEVVKQTY